MVGKTCFYGYAIQHHVKFADIHNHVHPRRRRFHCTGNTLTDFGPADDIYRRADRALGHVATKFLQGTSVQKYGDIKIIIMDQADMVPSCQLRNSDTSLQIAIQKES